MTRVLVLGAAGMLGSMLCEVLGRDGDLDVIASRREGAVAFDARDDDPGELLDRTGAAWAINAIGVLKSRIDESSSASIAQALEVNALFPHRLAEAAARRGVRVIAVGTDGVFSGRDGPYAEDAPRDAPDVYGQSKALGEAPGEHVVSLRCSIVGTAPGSLGGWLLDRPHAARVPGFADQRWNGLGTVQLARVCAGIVRGGCTCHGAVHVVPADVVTKAQLLRTIAAAFGRDDLEVVDTTSDAPADRSLATLDPARNEMLWHAAGYDRPPTIAAMVAELAAL